MRLRLLALTFSFGFGLAAQTTIQVPATADPWQAGGYMIPPYPYSPGPLPGEGSVPPEIDFAAGPGRLITIAASGIWSCGNDSQAGPGGGICNPYTSVDVAPTGGISGILVSPMTLAGVFLDAVNPPNVVQGNGIGTVFAIGTGGAFPIPPNATRLVLGMPDECSPDGPPIQPSCYGDNSGQVAVTYKLWRAAGLTISPSSGAPGTMIAIAGNGFAPGETVEIHTGQIGASPSYIVVADAGGSFYLQTRAVPGTYGTDPYFAVGVTSVSLGVAGFGVIPAIITGPKVGVPGQSIVTELVGFGAAESVELYWNSPRILLSTTTSDSTGTVKVSITIPLNAALGINGLIAIGQTTQAIGIGGVRVE